MTTVTPLAPASASAGDLAIWDDRTTMHHAAVDYGDAPRVMHCVTRRGDRPE